MDIGKWMRQENNLKKNALTALLFISLITNCFLLTALLIPSPSHHFTPTTPLTDWPYIIEVPSRCQLSVGIHYHTHLTYHGQEITNFYYIECGETSINTTIHVEWNNTIYSSTHIINCSSTTLSFTHIWDHMPRIPENNQDPDIFHHSFSYTILHYWS